MVRGYPLLLADQNAYGGIGRRFRREIADTFQVHSRDSHATSVVPVLLLFIESGALYCVGSVRNQVIRIFKLSTDYGVFRTRLYFLYSHASGSILEGSRHLETSARPCLSGFRYVTYGRRRSALSPHMCRVCIQLS